MDLAPVRGPLGQRGAAPELDVVGVGADREGARRCGKVNGEVHRPRSYVRVFAIGSVARSATGGGEIDWQVDIPSEHRVAHDPEWHTEPLCFGGVAAEGSRSVGELEGG